MKEYEVKDGLGHQYCDDAYFDFFEGKYLDPEKYLKNQNDIDEVNNARLIIKKYFETLSNHNLLES